jgi:hypothetical protein
MIFVIRLYCFNWLSFGLGVKEGFHVEFFGVQTNMVMIDEIIMKVDS